MVTASELKEGVALRIDRQIYRVLEVELKMGAARMGGTVRARLSNVHSVRRKRRSANRGFADSFDGDSGRNEHRHWASALH